MKYVINLNHPVLTSKGVPVEDGYTLAEAVADYLYLKPTKDEKLARKEHLWMKSLGKKEPLELDKVDFKTFSEGIGQSELRNAIKGPVLDLLDEAKAAAEAPKAVKAEEPEAIEEVEKG